MVPWMHRLARAVRTGRDSRKTETTETTAAGVVRPPRRSKRSRFIIGAAAATAAGLALAGCTAGNPSGSGGSNGASNAPSLLYTVCCQANPTFSYNPWNTNQATISDFVFLRLAVQKYPSLTDYAPQLASSWDVSGKTITVHLNPKAKWQDGTAVTSKDLYDTILLNGLNGAAVWNDITSVKTVDTHSVAFTLRDNEPVALAEYDILNTVVYPASVYGSFVTPQLEKDVPAYFAAYASDPTAAATTPEAARNAATFKNLAALSPKTMMGDGPFKLDRMTSSQQQLTKWDGFWLADKIKVPSMTITHAANQTIYPQLLSQNADYSNATMPPTVLSRWLGTKNANLAAPQANGFALTFNSSWYPLNIKDVRQALAYVIPRQKMTEAAYGTKKGAGGKWQQYLTGLSQQQNESYLSSDQMSKLNKYNPDEAKATQLLQGAGFTKKDGQWYTPKGTQFTLSLEVQSDTSDIVTSFTSAAQALTAFGIKSDVNATAGAQMTTDEADGNFQIAAFFPNGNTPLATFSAMLHDNNFQTSGNNAGKKGIGFGPTADVPGLGNVDVPATVYQQSTSIGPGDQMKKLTWDWAQFVNDQVPYIWYATKIRQMSFSTAHYTNWPKVGSDGTSAMWTIIGNNQSGGLVYAMEQGYVEPK